MNTTPTASPELLDLDKLEALAGAATAGPWLHRRDPGNPIGAQHCVKLASENGAWVCDCIDNADRSTIGGIAGERNAGFIAAANPAAVLALIALARRAQPEGEASLVEGDAIARSKRILHLVDEYVEQQTAGRRTALRCALMDQFSRDITPHQLLEVARATGLRQFLHGVNATDARQLLADFVAAVPAAACGVQQAAAPGAQLVIGVAAPKGATISIMQPHGDGTTTVIYGGTHPAGDSMGRAVVAAAPANSPEIPDGSLTDEGTSAPGTPEAPQTAEAVEWSFSTDEEHYRDPEPTRAAILRHAIAEIEADGEDSTFWIGKNALFTADIEPSWVIEQLQEQAFDECGEWAETFLEDVTDAEEAELRGMINEWAKRVDRSNFWTVGSVEKFTIESAREELAAIDRAAQLDGGQEGSESNG